MASLLPKINANFQKKRKKKMPTVFQGQIFAFILERVDTQKKISFEIN